MNSIPLWRRWWYLDWRPSSGYIHRGMCFIYFLNSGAGEGGCLSGEWEERYEVYEIFSKTVIIPLDKAKGGGRVKNRGWRTREGKYKEIHSLFFFLRKRLTKELKCQIDSFQIHLWLSPVASKYTAAHDSGLFESARQRVINVRRWFCKNHLSGTLRNVSEKHGHLQTHSYLWILLL